MEIEQIYRNVVNIMEKAEEFWSGWPVGDAPDPQRELMKNWRLRKPLNTCLLFEHQFASPFERPYIALYSPSKGLI